VLDTQRADRLSCYGYPRETSPYLDAFAARTTLYERAVAPAQWTAPAHASIFTGEYADRHNLLQIDSILGAELPTLAERLGQAGYYTAGFSHNPLIGEVNNGLGRGFQQFTNYQHKRTGLLTFHLADSAREHGLISRLRLGIRTLLAELLGYSKQTLVRHLAPLFLPVWSTALGFTRGTKETKAADSLEAAARLLIERPGLDRDQPAFVFINLMGTHVPYDPPNWAVERYMVDVLGRGSTNLLLQQANACQVNIRNWIDLSAPTDEVEVLLGACYDAEIATQDALVGAFFSRLEEANRLDPSFIAVVADHGDHLGDKRRVNHAFGVYEPLTWVPMIIHDPGADFPSGTTVPGTVSTRRLFHTALVAAGVADAQEASLALSADSSDHDLVFTQAVPLSWAVRRLQRDHRALFTRLDAGQISRAIYQDDYKLIQTGEQYELFNWRGDPAESENLISRQPELFTQLQILLQSTIEQYESQAEKLSQEAIDPQVLEHLRNLGYLE
jgi:arylsulfatase A-like enzyme